MKAEYVIGISTNAGMTEAGVSTILEMFEDAPKLKEVLSISNEELATLKSAEGILGKIYKNVKSLPLD